MVGTVVGADESLPNLGREHPLFGSCSVARYSSLFRLQSPDVWYAKRRRADYRQDFSISLDPRSDPGTHSHIRYRLARSHRRSSLSFLENGGLRVASILETMEGYRIQRCVCRSATGHWRIGDKPLRR